MAQASSVDVDFRDSNAVDSNYVTTYPDKLTGRFYFSRKYTNLSLIDVAQDANLDYESNTTLNIGIGLTVKTLSLNLAYGFDFLNQRENQGQTKYLDLQSHIYTKKFIIDFFGQFYKGLYLSNTSDYIANSGDYYYTRGDIYEQIIGVTGFYVFNHSTHSFRAAILQNERQLKSSGTWLIGLEAYYNLVIADSTLIPYFVSDDSFVQAMDANRIATFKVGPSGGYAHTFVVKKHFFLMLNLTVNIGVGRYQLKADGHNAVAKVGVDTGVIGRFALGYNSDRWYLGLTSIDNYINTSGETDGLQATFGIGNLRLNYAWRFPPGPKLRKLLHYD